MEWYNYLGCFFAGVFLTNALPHFIYGISGDKFPTPFAKPPGKGLSSPLVNTVWGLVNIIVGYVLFSHNGISNSQPLTVIVFFLGMAAIAIMLSINFQKKDKE